MNYNGISLTSNGGEDIFILKTNANTICWLKQIGGQGDDLCNDLVIDANGDIYLTGSYYYDCHFDYVTINSDTADKDYFVAKLCSIGFWYWIRHAGDIGQNEAFSIALDNYGFCYVTGYFTSEIFIGSTYLVAAGDAGSPLTERKDIFVAKLECEEGEWIWAQRAGYGLADCGYGVSTDPNGNCYVTGYINLTASPPATNLRNQLFIGKINSSGVWAWNYTYGSVYNDWGWDIATDSDGNSYIAGKFIAATTYGGIDLTAQGMYDAFVLKIASTGTVLWAVSAGGAGLDDATSIALNDSQSVFVTGSYHQDAIFGPYMKNSNGDSALYIAKLDSNGNWIWVTDASGSGHIYGYGVCIADPNTVYVAGIFDDVVNFGNYQLNSNYSDNAYSVCFAQLFDVQLLEPSIVVGVEINNLGSTLMLSWEAVTESTQHDPLVPDYYKIYYSETGCTGPFQVLGYTSDTSYTFPNPGILPSKLFFYVTACTE
jgi:hypothetical protein